MANILLITPLNIPFKDMMSMPKGATDIQIKRKLDPKYPVGLLNIGAYVEKYAPGSKVWILDYNTEAPRYLEACKEMYLDPYLNGLLDWVLNKIPVIPDIIGISALFESNYCDMGAIIEFMRWMYPDSIIVAGGHLASARYEDFLNNFPQLNAVCYGEGENPILQLVKAMDGGPATAWDVVGEEPWWITKDKIHQRNFRPSNWMIDNLDEIPRYDLTMLRYPDDYLNTNDDLFALGTDRRGEKDIYMFATRGCPYHCIFCASQFVHGHKVRSYSTERIKQDIVAYNRDYRMTSFPFLDDHFLADKKKALDILEFIYRNGLTSRIFNLNYIHVDREIIQALKRTGSDRILITLDGLNEKFLRKVVKKPADFKKAKEVIQICREEGIVVISNIIIGYPGETLESIDFEADALWDMGANWYSILTAAPFHGSELYDICQKNGYLAADKDITAIDYHHTAIHTSDWGPAEIQKMAYQLNLRINFVGNWDMRHGEFDIPLTMFMRVLEIEPNHAFAWYFGAICAEAMALTLTYHKFKSQYRRVMEQCPEWKEWAEWFNLKEI